eukprot:403370959
MELRQQKIERVCPFGLACVGFNNGNCRQVHVAIHSDTKSTGSQVYQRIRVECKEKDDCTFPNCKFVHPRDNYVPPVRETPICKWDQDCANIVCPFIHSTKSQNSPAFEKELEKQKASVMYNIYSLGEQPQVQPQNMYTGSNQLVNGGNHVFGNNMMGGQYVKPQQLPPYQMPPQQFPSPDMSPLIIVQQVIQLQIIKQELAIQQ